MGLTPCEEYGHEYRDIASWPSGPSGETTTLRRCLDCGDEYEDERP